MLPGFALSSYMLPIGFTLQILGNATMVRRQLLLKTKTGLTATYSGGPLVEVVDGCLQVGGDFTLHLESLEGIVHQRGEGSRIACFQQRLMPWRTQKTILYCGDIAIYKMSALWNPAILQA